VDKRVLGAGSRRLSAQTKPIPPASIDRSVPVRVQSAGHQVRYLTGLGWSCPTRVWWWWWFEDGAAELCPTRDGERPYMPSVMARRIAHKKENNNQFSSN
jgi:hypothetical protein